MQDASTLKQRIRNGHPIKISGTSVHSTEEVVRSLIDTQAPDLIGTDMQHSAANEDKLRDLCAMANAMGTPVQLRIKHTRHAYLIGNLLDLGPMAILVPQIDTEATVDEAVNAFYYPPIGKRSWGPSTAHGYDANMERREYADWWNRTGVLAIQIESIDAVVNVRALAKQGVDMVMFGANDLMFDIETYADPPLTTLEECIDHVQRQLDGTGVRVAAGKSPGGTF